MAPTRLNNFRWISCAPLCYHLLIFGRPGTRFKRPTFDSVAVYVPLGSDEAAA